MFAAKLSSSIHVLYCPISSYCKKNSKFIYPKAKNDACPDVDEVFAIVSDPAGPSYMQFNTILTDCMGL